MKEPLASGLRLPTDEGRVGPDTFRETVPGGPSLLVPVDAGLPIPRIGAIARVEVPRIAGEKEDESSQITVPAIRRALQGLLNPRAKPITPIAIHIAT